MEMENENNITPVNDEDLRTILVGLCLAEYFFGDHTPEELRAAFASHINTEE